MMPSILGSLQALGLKASFCQLLTCNVKCLVIIVFGISLIQLGIKMWSAHVRTYMRDPFLLSDTTIAFCQFLKQLAIDVIQPFLTG